MDDGRSEGADDERRSSHCLLLSFAAPLLSATIIFFFLSTVDAESEAKCGEIIRGGQNKLWTPFIARDNHLRDAIETFVCHYFRIILHLAVAVA